ncbi:MAG: S8 family serine peptidase [Cyanobacteriota bacterium]
MKKIFNFSVATLILVSSLSSCAERIKGNVSESNTFSTIESNTPDSLPSGKAENQYLIKRRGLAYLQKETAFSEKFNLKILKKIPNVLIDVVEMESSDDVKALKDSGLVEYIEPNYIRQMVVRGSGSSEISASSSKDIGVSKVNSLYKGSPYITVAVVSTGVDTSHPALKNKLLKGFSTFSSEDSENDINGIGTHQAGVIAAEDSENSVFGISPNCKVMPIKAYNDRGEVKDSDLIQGSVWALEHGANIVTFTADGASNSQVFQDLFKYAFTKKVPIIIGSGDLGTDQPSFPASSGGAIVVSSISSGSSASSFSNKSKYISVSAPGENIKSLSTMKKLIQTSKTATLSGTAISAAYAAGEMALIRSKYTDLDLAGMKKHLEQNVDAVSAQYSDSTGYGVISPVKAVSVKIIKK